MKLKVVDLTGRPKKSVELQVGDVFKFKDGIEFYMMSENGCYSQLTGTSAGRTYNNMIRDVELVKATLTVEAIV